MPASKCTHPKSDRHKKKVCHSPGQPVEWEMRSDHSLCFYANPTTAFHPAYSGHRVSPLLTLYTSEISRVASSKMLAPHIDLRVDPGGPDVRIHGVQKNWE